MSTKTDAVIMAYNQGYRVSADGLEVISPYSGLPLKLQLNNKGYLEFKIQEKYRVSVRVHRLQAYQKYGDKLLIDGVLVRHLNGDSKDNNVNNIALGTYSDNAFDKSELNRTEHALKGSRSQRKLSWEQMEQLRQDRTDGATYKVLCERYEVAKSTVSYIVNNKTYNLV